MAKTATEKTTKTATKRATKKTASDKPKEKRAPSAYNIFVKENMKPWKEANPDKPYKEGMKYVAELWRSAPENPNRGKEPKAKTATKVSKAKPKPKAASPSSDGEQEIDD